MGKNRAPEDHTSMRILHLGSKMCKAQKKRRSLETIICRILVVNVVFWAPKEDKGLEAVHEASHGRLTESPGIPFAQGLKIKKPSLEQVHRFEE